MRTRAVTIEVHRALADRRLFRLDKKRWARFVRALDRPAVEKPRLRELLRRSSVLDCS